jgi:ATP-dependent DNA helicase RecQ
LSVFGIGTDLRDSEWRGVVRQLLARGLLAVEGEYGTLVLTDASATVLRGQSTVMMRREPERRRVAAVAKPRTGSAAADLPAEAAPLFDRLRAWRAAAAKELGVPAYVVFHDATLRQIAALRPPTLDALATVSGVGETKLARFGEQVLEVVAAA